MKTDNFKCFPEARFNPLNAELNPICHFLALLGFATIVVVSRLRVNGTYTGNFRFTWENLIRVQHKWEIDRVSASYRDYCSVSLCCTRKNQEGGVRSLHNQTMDLFRWNFQYERRNCDLTCHQHEVCHACSFHYMPFCNNSAREIINVAMLLTFCQNSAILLPQKN